jgi:hypothetical protein
VFVESELIELEDFDSYKIDYSGEFWQVVECCKLLILNGRGERI